MFSYSGDNTSQLPAILVGAVVILVGVVASQLFGYSSLGKFPFTGSQNKSYPKRLMTYLYHAESLYREGYAKFKNVAYRMTTADGERIVIPSHYLDELRLRPDHEVNNQKALIMSVEAKYTGLDPEAPLLNHMVRADLTRNLPRINTRLGKEVDRSVKTELPPCDDWTPVVINERLLRIVAIVSGHIFLGPDLCRREEYLHASINYTIDVFAAVRALKKWPSIIRPIARYFTPQLKGIRDHEERAKQFLIPIIQQRKELMKTGQEVPDDMLQWTLNKSESFNAQEDAKIATLQLTLSMAAIHTTTMTATHILYDLLARPEIIVDLRKEIKSVLEETGGEMTTHALFRMKLLDSVMRESQRLNPLNMARFARFVEKPITLQDGTKLPAGVIVEAAHLPITRDPNLYPDPETFDPYRFLRLRSGEVADPIGYKSTEQYQFVTVAKENMSFGYGRHACPGRFFAANEIKLIMARLLLDFDFKMPDGQTERFENITVASSVIPDAKKEILMRRVQS